MHCRIIMQSFRISTLCMVLVAVVALLVVDLSSFGHSYSINGAGKKRCPQSTLRHRIFESIQQPRHQQHVTMFQSRQRFLSVVVGGLLSGSAGAILTSGSKSPVPAACAAAPVNEACLSKCLYECTKPKGSEQKSRAECLPECKKQCRGSPSS
jgi:hypothetical protein